MQTTATGLWFNYPMKILLHSSKTMKAEVSKVHELSSPQFIKQAEHLAAILKNTDDQTLQKVMGISEKLMVAVREDIEKWTDDTDGTAAALTFRGDIYSGLAAAHWGSDDAQFAQKHLRILSGLYGILRPFDHIKPYRLEMGYRFMIGDSKTLTQFWKQELTQSLDPDEMYINLTAKEYFDAVHDQLRHSTVISPKFLTINQKTKQPTFVTVHAKIARGSFANWMIKDKITNPKDIVTYDQLNYIYDENLSTTTEPVFVCETFEGIGLSVRLK
jgi:hypothetical protein